MASGGREETAHVSGQDGRSREPCSPRQQGSQDSQTQRRCHSSAKAGNVFVVDLWVRKDATSRRPGFHQQA